MSRFARRAFMKGAGGGLLALPFMRAQALAGEAPKRLVTFAFEVGAYPDLWNFEQTLSPLVGLRGKIAALRGLSNHAADDTTHQTDHHMRGCATVFVGSPLAGPSRPGGSTVEAAAAKLLAPATLVPHLVLGTNGIDANYPFYSCRSFLDGDFVPPIGDPAEVFRKLFAPLLDREQTRRLASRRASVLDCVTGLYSSATADAYGLGREARQRLTDHLDIVRALEQRITQETPAAAGCQIPAASESNAAFAGGDPEKTIRMHLDLLVQAFSCDLTRFASVQFNRVGIVVDGADEHEVSHLGADAGTKGRLVDIKRHYMMILAEFLAKMDSIVESNGRTMLDNTIVIAAPELGDPGQHFFSPTPHLVAGGGALGLKGGVDVDHANGKSINDLYLTCLRALGIDVPTFGSPEFNTGPIGEIL